MRMIRVGVDEAPPAPMNFGLPGSRDFHGFEVDLLHAIAERIGCELEFRSSLWSQLLGDLSENKLDLVCGAATITEERSRYFDFSDPYLDIELVIVGRANDSSSPAPENATFGVRVATHAESYQKRHWSNNVVRLFDFNTDAYHALQSGGIDLVIDDSPIAMHFAEALHGLQVLNALPGTDAQYALVLRKGNTALLDQVNTALRTLQSEGTWNQLYRRWFPHGSKLSG